MRNKSRAEGLAIAAQAAKNKRLEAAQVVIASSGGPRIRALSPLAFRLAEMSASDRENLKLLELLVWTDPIAVAWLTALANTTESSSANPAKTVASILQLLGPKRAYPLLASLWFEDLSFEPSSVTEHLLSHASALFHLIRRIAVYKLTEDRSSTEGFHGYALAYLASLSNYVQSQKPANSSGIFRQVMNLSHLLVEEHDSNLVFSSGYSLAKSWSLPTAALNALLLDSNKPTSVYYQKLRTLEFMVESAKSGFQQGIKPPKEDCALYRDIVKRKIGLQELWGTLPSR